MENVTNPVLSVTVFDAANIDNALEVVAKYNRRAARAGIAEQYTVVTSTTTVPDPFEGLRAVGDLPGAVREVTTFVVLGKPLVLAGWEFVATLSFDEEAGVVTRPVPGATVVDLTQYRSLKAPKCDACGTARRRTDVYVLRSEAGEHTVVGRNCLAAFIGLDPSTALRYVGEEFGGRDELEGFVGAREEWRFPATTVLAVASAAIAAFGWVPASAYDGVATRERVGQVLYPLPTHKAAREEALATRAAIEAKLDETGGPSRALARAQEVLAWVRGGEVGSSEYAQNLMAVLKADTVGARNLGLAVSAVSAWAKAQDRALEQAARRERLANSEWVGTVGERIKGLSLTVAQQPRFFEGDYGVSTLLVLTDAQGNAYKWFASGSWDLEVGTVLTGAGTVKKHEDYNGAKSTVLTRCRF